MIIGIVANQIKRVTPPPHPDDPMWGDVISLLNFQNYPNGSIIFYDSVDGVEWEPVSRQPIVENPSNINNQGAIRFESRYNATPAYSSIRREYESNVPVTIEFFCKLENILLEPAYTYSGIGLITSILPTAQTDGIRFIRVNGKLYLGSGSIHAFTGEEWTDFDPNKTYHFCIMKDPADDVERFYVDGTIFLEGFNYLGFTVSGGCILGAYNSFEWYGSGTYSRVSSFRVTKGNRYNPLGFTPPSYLLPFPDYGNGGGGGGEPIPDLPDSIGVEINLDETVIFSNPENLEINLTETT